MIRFRPEKGCKLSQGYPRRTLPQQASCLLPHEQCYACYFPSFSLIPGREKKKHVYLKHGGPPIPLFFSIFLSFRPLPLSCLCVLLSQFYPPLTFSLFVLSGTSPVLWSFLSVHMLLEFRGRDGGREERSSSTLLLREHLLLSSPLVHRHRSLSFTFSVDQRAALTSDRWMHYRGAT